MVVTQPVRTGLALNRKRPEKTGLVLSTQVRFVLKTGLGLGRRPDWTFKHYILHTDSIADLAATALTNVEGLQAGLQELPHFDPEDHAGTEVGFIDFSLLGGTETAADSAA